MIGTIYITGEIGVETSVMDVIKQVKAQPNAQSYLVKIDSIGGYVDAGNDIYKYLKNLDSPVTTYAIQAYSIASVIFMAGSTRIVSEGSEKAIMIHLPWMEVAGSHDVITSHLSELKATEDQLVKFYSEALQIDKDTIQSLLSNETYLNATQAKDLGFATMIEPRKKAVAKLHNNEIKEESSMNNKQTDMLTTIYNFVTGKKAIKAELILQDGTGAELIFPELADGDNAEQGAKATIDGKPADGSYPMPDGSTLVFQGGILEEIMPAEITEEVEAENAEGDEVQIDDDAPASEDKDAKIAELEAENEALKAKIAEMESSQASAKDEENDKMLEILEISAKKTAELEAKYHALAKQIGSDFQPETIKENTPAIKAKGDETPKFSIKRK